MSQITCPTCNGAKKITVKVFEDGQPASSFQCDCLTCGGTGEVTAAEQASWKRAQERWCSCEKDFGAYYVEDGEDPYCRKHHWNCAKCHKIKQIG